MKKVVNLLLILFSVSLLVAGGGKEKAESSYQSETRVFIDDLGRKVILPVEIKRIAPSGNVAQLALYATSADELVGWGSNLATKASEFLPKTIDLPRFGAFYGAKADLNKEAVIAAAPDVIIDIGEIKGSEETMIHELDSLEKILGIPVIFIQGTLRDYEHTFHALGEITGNKMVAGGLEEFAHDAVRNAEERRRMIEDRVTFYYSTSDDALTTYPAGSFHTEAIELVGGVNVVPASLGSNVTANMEQIYLWNPDVILLSSLGAYEEVTTSTLWQTLEAVKSNRVYLIPTDPYNVLDTPPSIQMLLGIYWAGKMLYPELWEDIDLIAKTKDYFALAYGAELTDERAGRIISSEPLFL